MDRKEPRLELTVADGVAALVISNPAKRNAMTTAMWQSLPVLLEELAADSSVRALVLTGAGDTFCAGADISSLRDPSGAPQGLAVAAEEALAAFPRPSIAAVRGYCVGGGASWRPPATCGSPRRGRRSASPPRSSGSSTPRRRPAGWSR